MTSAPFPRVFIDARLAVRGLGIASAKDRFVRALADIGLDDAKVNASDAGWTGRGRAETVLKTGALDLSPRLDPRVRHYGVTHYYGNTAPQFPDHTTVVTVHDLMCLRRPDRSSRLFQSLLLPGLRRIRGAGQVVAISTQTADDIVAAVPNLGGKVTVIPHGRRAYRYSDRDRTHVMMFGGESDPRKRVQLGIEAYRAYADLVGSAALPLIVAGRAGVSGATVAGSIGSSGCVEFRRNPSDSEVADLLAGAACVIYPSAEEGFGLPIVEAGEVGTPVVYERDARIPCEALGSHALAVPGTGSAEWARAVRAAVDMGPVPDALDRLPTWEQTARAYLDLYRSRLDSS